MRTPVLAGWAAGTRAEKLSVESDDALLDHAFESLTHIFGVPKGFLEGMLAEFYMHNWQRDPLAAGAYKKFSLKILQDFTRLTG